MPRSNRRPSFGRKVTDGRSEATRAAQSVEIQASVLELDLTQARGVAWNVTAAPPGTDPLVERNLRLVFLVSMVVVVVAFEALWWLAADAATASWTLGVTLLLPLSPLLFRALNSRGWFDAARRLVMGAFAVQCVLLVAAVGSDQGAQMLLLPLAQLALGGYDRYRFPTSAAVFGLFLVLDQAGLEGSVDFDGGERVATLVLHRVCTVGLLFGVGYASVLDNQAVAAQVSRVSSTLKRTAKARQVAEKQSQGAMQFISVMSHEIRTPLNAVIGLSDILSSALEETEHFELASTIASSSQALLTVINDVLDFSRSDAGHVSLVDTTTSLDTLLDNTVQALYSAAAAKKLQLCTDVQLPFPFMVSTDAVRVRQVLTNLVGNAIKFTEQGSVVVSAKLFSGGRYDAMIKGSSTGNSSFGSNRSAASLVAQWSMGRSRGRRNSVQPSKDPAKTLVEFSVTDTGCGIPADALATIFEPFRQAEQGTKRRFDGTGLGLAICKRIVRAMGGRMGVESTVGVGTTFWVSIPMLLLGGDAADLFHFGAQLPVAVILGAEGGSLMDSLYNTMPMVGGRVVEYGDCVPGLVLLEHLGEERTLKQVADVRKRYPSAHVVLITTPFQSCADSTIPLVVQPVRRQALHDIIGRIQGKVRPKSPRTASLVESAAALSDSDYERLSRTRVLVAEDNAVNQKVIGRMMSKLGVRFQVVDNGALCVQAHRDQPADIVFMDCHMPVLDGFDATRAIREFDTETPILALTADAFDEARQQALEAGMVEVLTKPILLSQLSAAILQFAPVSSQVEAAASVGPKSFPGPPMSSPAAGAAAVLPHLKSTSPFVGTPNNNKPKLEPLVR